MCVPVCCECVHSRFESSKALIPEPAELPRRVSCVTNVHLVVCCVVVQSEWERECALRARVCARVSDTESTQGCCHTHLLYAIHTAAHTRQAVGERESSRREGERD